MRTLPGTGGAVTATRQPFVEIVDGRLPRLLRTAWLEVDLDALVSNLRLVRGMLPPGVRIEPVVKADAYGHGAVPVARALVGEGIGSLSVATFDEALELRQAGMDIPILIVFPIPPDLGPDAQRLGLSVTAGDTILLARMLTALGQHDPAAAWETHLAQWPDTAAGGPEGWRPSATWGSAAPRSPMSASPISPPLPNSASSTWWIPK